MSVIVLLILLGWSGAAEAATVRSGSDELVVNSIGLLLTLLLWFGYERGARHTPVRAWRRWLLRSTLVLALVIMIGPVDRLAEVSAAAHMAQHMAIIALLAPMFAIARPLPQLLVGFGRVGRPVWQWGFKITQFPMLCAYIHGVVIWFWHVPYFYMLAVQNSWVHGLAHMCFLVSAIWFWWACLYPAQRNIPFALLALLLTLMHTGFLGALLTFAAQPLYSEARHLQDQQLAGLLMWVIGGFPYMAASIWAGHRWYKKLQRQIQHG